MQRLITVISVCVLTLAACGGSAKKSANPLGPSANGPTTTPSVLGSATTGGQAPQGTPIGKIRVANLLYVNGAPGPAMDLYDTLNPGPNTPPIIKDLQYGQVSDYVTPHGPVSADATSQLWAYPAGSTTRDPQALLSGANIDQSGFASDDQLTIGLFKSSFGMGSVLIVEAGKRTALPEIFAAQPGKGVLLVESEIADDSSAPSEYLTVDGSCVSSTGIGRTTPSLTTLGTSPATVFVVAPGTHKLGIVTSPAGSGLTPTTCSQKTPPTTTTVDVTADQRVDIFVYGDPNAPKVVAAPVAS